MLCFGSKQGNVHIFNEILDLITQIMSFLSSKLTISREGIKVKK